MQPGNQPDGRQPRPISHFRVIPAVILIGLGILFLLDNLGILSIDRVWQFWPVLLIGLGLFLLVNRTVWHFNMGRYCRDGYAGAYQSGGGYRVRESAVFGGGKRRINAQDFTGGKIEAVFSGYEVDFRDAGMQGDTAILKVDVVFGGAELRIPETWSVVVQGNGVFGAFSDTSRQPDPARTPNAKRLIVKGSAVFGGVEIRN